MSVRKKMAQGFFWVLMEKVGQQILNFAVFLIVARLIGPEEFGLAGLCVVFSVFSNLIVFGAADAVISQRLTEDRQLSTLFWSVIGIGLSLSLATFLVAEPFGKIMGDVRLSGLLRRLAIQPSLVAGLVIPTLLIQARMDFRIFTIRVMVSIIIGGSLGIFLAFKGYGAAALIYQQIAQGVVSNLIVWSAAKWRPRFLFVGPLFRKVLTPGVKMTGSNLITFVEQQVPRLLIGFFLGPVSVGYYALVSRVFVALRDTLVLPIANVLYPALAQIREDPEDVRRMIGQIVLLTGILFFPCLAGAAITAPQFVPLFFGDRWIPAIPVLQLYLIAGMPTPFLMIIRELLRAHGRTGVFIRIQLLITGLNLLFVLILVRQGLVAMLWGLIITSVISFPVGLRILNRSTGFSFAPPFLKLGAPLIAAALMVGAVATLQASELQPSNSWASLIASIVAGTAVYVGALVAIQFRQIRALAIQMIELVKRKTPNSR